MLLGLSLFYVGAVLILNGLWMLGRIGDREIAVINLFTGGLTLLVSLKLAFGDGDVSSFYPVLAAFGEAMRDTPRRRLLIVSSK